MRFEGDLRGTAVYVIKYNDVAIYVGKTSQGIKVRINNHFRNAKSQKGRLGNLCPKLYKFIRENPDNDRYEILVLGYFTSQEANERERFYIKKYNTRVEGLNPAPGLSKGLPRCNKSPGGIVSGPDHYLYGNKVSRHVVEASIAARKGKQLTEAHKKAQREGHQNNKHLRKDLRAIICKETEKEWISLADCAREFNVHPTAIIARINKVLVRNRKNEKLGKYTFAYKDER